MNERPAFACDYCGLETPEASAHLRRAHGLTLDEWLARRSAREEKRLRDEHFAAIVSHIPDCDCFHA